MACFATPMCAIAMYPRAQKEFIARLGQMTHCTYAGFQLASVRFCCQPRMHSTFIFRAAAVDASTRRARPLASGTPLTIGTPSPHAVHEQDVVKVGRLPDAEVLGRFHAGSAFQGALHATIDAFHRVALAIAYLFCDFAAPRVQGVQLTNILTQFSHEQLWPFRGPHWKSHGEDGRNAQTLSLRCARENPT